MCPPAADSRGLAPRRRRGRRIRRTGARLAGVAVALAAAVGPAAPGQAGDPVTAYLEDLGAADLVAVRLEQLVREERGDDRSRHVARLAELYPGLIEAATDPAEREQLIERARAVVRIAGAGDTMPLELAIVRAGFREAERTAEQWRLRIGTEARVADARLVLQNVAAELDDLSDEVRGVIERSRTRATRASGSQAIAVADDLDEAVRMTGELDYLAGWVGYYRAWLGDPAADIVATEERFEALLDLGDAGAVPDAVDTVSLAEEGYARAVLGVALCRSLSSTTSDALGWLGLLENPGTHPAVRDQLPGWRLAVLVEQRDWRSVNDRLGEMIGESGTPVDWLRLVAVHALEASGDRLAAFVARAAVGELGRRGELSILYDVVNRYGADQLGAGGFLVRYVQAVSAFAEASERHGREVGPDAAARAAWRSVAEVLVGTLDALDVADHPGAAADAERLLGWCLWYAGDAAAAWTHFRDASERLPAASAAEAAWMAVVCLDQLVLAGRDDLAATADALAEGFLDRFPGDANAPALRARRIARSPMEASESDLEALLAVPRGNDRWRESRATVAAVLARRWRAGGPTAVEDGRRYLRIAAELLDDPDPSRRDREPTRFERDSVRLSLEIALDRRVMDLDRAAAGLARVQSWRRDGWSPGPVETELVCRSVQHALALGEWAAAADLVAPLASAGRAFESTWTRTALAFVLDAAASDRVIRARLEDAWPVARGVLAAVEPGAEPVASLDGLRLILAAGRIGREQWGNGSDPAAGEIALAAAQAALEPHPLDRSLLRLTGRLATGQRRDALALECWRTLSEGLEPPDPDWYEARFGVATVLARSLPDRARQVLEQHVVLEPTYGPAPWNARMKALHDRLRANAADGSDEANDAPGDAERSDADGGPAPGADADPDGAGGADGADGRADGRASA